MDLVDIILALAFCVIAFLYSSVGHAGASGYLAVMALAGVSYGEMRSSALVMNIVVASLASYKYIKAKRFSLNVFLSFALTSIPFSFFGGRVELPNREIKIFLGIVLLLSAFLMLIRVYFKSEYDVTKLPISMGIVGGSIIGFLSGLTSVGGGIFLTPLLVFFRWATIKNASGIAALFILVNSIAGIFGQFTNSVKLNHSVWIWSIAVIIGGFFGSEFGSRKFENNIILGLIFVVLIIAAVKMFII